MPSEDQKYLYSYYVWPSETAGFSKATFDLFRSANFCRFEQPMTEKEFWEHRHQLEDLDNFTLREISRVPDVQPETVL